MVKLPVVPGHEISATVEAGHGRRSGNPQEGYALYGKSLYHCEHCSSCRNGRPNACRYNQTLGVQRDGAMSEYIVVPWQKVIADDAISERNFTLVEPMSVGFHAVSRAAVTDLDVVMVIGCGMIGIGALVRAALRVHGLLPWMWMMRSCSLQKGWEPSTRSTPPRRMYTHAFRGSPVTWGPTS